jgi:hypothetical protein
MKPWQRRLIAICVALTPVVAALSIYYYQHRVPRETSAPPKPEAPPDLEKLRPAFVSGLDALRRNDGLAAVRYFSSFKFGGRAVEEYRLAFLASAYQLTATARPRGFSLRGCGITRRLVNWRTPRSTGNDYADISDWDNAIAVYRGIAARTIARRSPLSRAGLVNCGFGGNPGLVLEAAHDIVVKVARAAGVDAIAILRTLWSLSPTQPLKLNVPSGWRASADARRRSKDALPG